MGDIAMRDAAAFGYLSESRATKEYWFDVDHQNLPSTYPHSFVGVVYDGGMNYGTFFSGKPIHIHGIQWLPWAPIMNHMAEYPNYLKADYDLMKAEEQTRFGVSDESDFGADWANVALCYEQMYDSAYATKRFDEYWSAPVNSNYNKVTKDVTAGQSYYYMHSNKTMGAIQWNYHTSAPNSQVYYNAAANIYSYVGFNAKMSVENIIVYKDGVAIGSFNVPAYSSFNKHTLETLGLGNFDLIGKQIKVYPNPFKEVTTVEFNNTTDLKIKNVEIFNILGQIIEKIKIDESATLIKVGQNYHSGIYLIKVYGYFGSRTYKMIKK
jgi:hypothetical protein